MVMVDVLITMKVGKVYDMLTTGSTRKRMKVVLVLMVVVVQVRTGPRKTRGLLSDSEECVNGGGGDGDFSTIGRSY